MKCTILRWLLGIWLVEIVAARHIQNGEEQSLIGRSSRDQYHRQPFYGMGQSPHLSYNSFRSSMRRTPPQSPHRRNLVEQDPSFSPNGEGDHEFGTNYFFSNDQPQIHPYHKNQQNLNVYSAVRLHGALEARAKAEPGSATLLSQNHHYSNFNHPPQFKQPERQWRRGNEPIDGESEEGGNNNDDLARFSLYNSYFDNEHSIKALNSMKCVTPTGSPGFCSTFRGCVPSFFTKEGELEAPALAELISTSIGYCTTNVSHHFIREQREQQFSREERRFNSVANRIICCPGVAPIRDPNQDPDKIFNDYLEAQRQKQKTTTTSTTTSTTTPIPPSEISTGDEESGAVNDGQSDGPQPDASEAPISEPEGQPSVPDGQVESVDSSMVMKPKPEEQVPEQSPVSEGQVESENSMMQPKPVEQISGHAPVSDGQVESENSMMMKPKPDEHVPGSSHASDAASASESSDTYPEGQVPSADDSSVSEANTQVPILESSSLSPESQFVETSSSNPDSSADGSSVYPSEQSPVSEGSVVNPEDQSSSTSSSGSEMYPETESPSTSAPVSSAQPEVEPSSASYPDSAVNPEGQSTNAPVADQPSESEASVSPTGTVDSNSSHPEPEPQPSSELPSMPVHSNTEMPVTSEVPSDSDSQNAQVSADSSDSIVQPHPPSESSDIESGSVVPSTDSPIVPSQVPPSESESHPSMDEADDNQPEQSMDTTAPVSSSVTPPIQEQVSEQSSSTDVTASPPPGTQDPQSPGKSTDSPIYKIKPDPVTGANGKFTLPGGLYIVSSSTDHPQSNQNQVRPSSGGTETIADSMPIFIVKNPSTVVEMMPHFPSDFPAMPPEPIAPVDDSSLELQRPSTSPPPSSSSSITTTTTDLPSSSTSEASSESVVSTSVPEQAQQDEASRVTTVQSVSQDDQSASGDATTSLPLADGEDDEANDALTLVPMHTDPTPKSGPSSTTELPVASGGEDNIAATTVGSSSAPVSSGIQNVEVQPAQAGSNLDITTISSVQSVGSQEVEQVTTIRPVEGVASIAGAGSSQENVETTPGYIAATTPADSEESDESSEEVRATPSDDQKTTVAPSAGDENENDLTALRTTTMLPVNNDDNEIDQEDESIPTQPPVSSGSQSIQTEQDVTTQSVPVSSGTASHQDQHEVNSGSGDQVSETMQPFPESSPAPSGGQQLFPDSQQQQFPDSQQQPFPDPEPAGTTVSAPVSSDDQQEPVHGSGSAGQVPGSEAESSSQVPSESNIGIGTRIPTTGAPLDPINTDQQSSTEPVATSSGVAAANDEPSSGDSNGEGGVEFSPIGGGESSSSGGESSTVSGNDSSYPSGSESSTEGSVSSGSGSDSSVSGDDTGSTSTPGSIISSSVGPGSDSLVSVPPANNDEPSAVPSEPSSSSPSEENGIPESAPSSASESPEGVPSNDEPSAVNNSDSVPDSQSSLSSSSSTASTATSTVVPPTESESGGDSPAENISKENVPQIPSESPEDAPPMQGSSQQADSPVSSDSMQDSQPIVSTSEAPQNVSQTDAPVEESSPSSEAMSQTTTSTTAAPLDPEVAPEDVQPNYQILKACKFQSFFRSISDYSYRHYPWLATIVGGTRPFSSGTLITDRHILTASHFLSNITVSDVFNMRIHIGYRTSYSGQTEGPYAVRKVRKVIRHKGFSFEKLYNDIAVLVLDRPVRFSEDIYPVCISSNSRAYADGTAEAFETGWIEDPRTYTISQHHNYIDPHIQKYFSFGYKNITWRLQEAPQRVRTNLECQSNYGFLEKNGIMVTDSMVCAGSGDTRSCAFRGNSGAPLFMRNEDDRMTEQIGIVSWGIGCGHFPFVFTRLEAFLPWLDRVVYNSR